MRKLVVVLIFACLLVGCSNTSKTAKDIGKGISVEIQTNKTLKHVSLEKYVNGTLIATESAINANNSAFEKGEIVIFDIPIDDNGEETEFSLIYSENLDGTNSSATEKINVTSTKTWVHFILNEQLQLEQ